MTLVIQKPTSSKLVLAKDYTPGDPFFSNVSLLLLGDGTNGSTTILDSSPTPKTVTVFGNTQISTAQSKFSGGSTIALDGTGDYITFPSITINSDEDCTFEVWIYKTAIDDSGYSVVFSNSDAAINHQFTTDSGSAGSIGLILFQTSIVASAGSTATLNAWHHLAWTRQANTWRTFINGLLISSAVSSAQFAIDQVGRFRNGGYEVNGFLSNVRITKGVARYTANFTLPTAPFPDAQF